ncbi:ATP-dependent 6-phosphofructokinase [Breznakiella homolactica]|uniref:ATP-dependent 6-phosphofructokinase n=1 Tax=Breznakiella homolactica TaxID=2798577 RepID=A0A7T7XNV9_9SPIR|nr:ATP-dependent 6-phosphofructokinase [Breznakiella homolactica]QQO09766.1 ATP-dependent 6-phosphofructokinase [Breznakiella homolactica]
MSAKIDFSVEELGKRGVKSPIKLSKVHGDFIANYVTDNEFVLYNVDVVLGDQPPIDRTQVFEAAGPREMIYFSPQHVHAGIVTCGGLCPGLNDVIRAIVRCLWFRYGVRRISGIRYGYKGLIPEYGFNTKELDPEVVDDIHKIGGTILGSARGGGKQVTEIVDSMERLNLNMLFAIGGDGTQRGALDIAEEVGRRNLKIAVIGIPKTVDNDFSFIQRSFGFDTAVNKAVEVVTAAHMEAHSQINGIGLVKLMGRESGFIAAHTALASHEVNFVLIPEVPFDIKGPNGLLHHLEERLQRRSHAVIVVAEGAMQDKLVKEVKTDESGNLKMVDVGRYLRDQIQEHFDRKKIEINLKYIDPSYMIRSAPAVPVDSIYCERLGNAAVHAAMAGKTKTIIGLINNEFVHIPMKAAVSQRNHVDPEGNLWRDTLDATNQPILMENKNPQGPTVSEGTDPLELSR